MVAQQDSHDFAFGHLPFAVSHSLISLVHGAIWRFLVNSVSKFLQKSSNTQNISVTLDRKATTLCRRVFRTIGWCSGNDLETVLFAMLCLVLLRGLLFATKVHKNSNSPKFPSSFVGVLTQYKKKG